MNTRMTEQAAPCPDLLRAELVANLVARGVLTSAHWRKAFLDVPRHRFVDRFTVLTREGSRQHDLSDPARRDEAMVTVHQDTALITQEDAGGTATSSSSQPSMMAMMLESADLGRGMNVLEIGTGTGYNAALLTHALGASSVTSIDIHPDLTTAAERALHGEGYEPTVICGDGGQGCAQHAPYDRIIATCSVARIPKGWIGQLKPGGIIVVNVGFGLARLTLAADGALQGPFLDYASFMPMRADACESTATARQVLNLTERTAPRGGRPRLPVEERMITVLRSVIMPGVTYVVEKFPAGDDHVLVHPESGSWARALDAGAESVAVSEGGPRRLWTELEEIVQAWTDAGRPAISDCGLTVTREGEHILWIGSPDRHRWPLG